MQRPGAAAIAFALIYFTFFLDNVLLTVLVPIIPDWLRGEAVALWARDAPLAALLNHTADDAPGTSQAVVGAVLGAKAAAQLLVAPAASAAVRARGPAPVLRLATGLLALAAIALRCVSGWGGRWAAWCVGGARAAHGAGSALGGVAGLALAARALPAHSRDRAIGALLGAVALGVLVGYPFGGATMALWSRGTSFLLIAAALLVNLAMQYMFLDGEEFNKPLACGGGGGGGGGSVCAVSRRGAARACAGAVLLTTAVMATLEPTLPLFIMHKFHSQRWVVGAVFVPDSAGYLLAASALGGAARALGAERVALSGQLAVGLAALAIPHANSVLALALPHVALGAGLGATDAALVPALLARHRTHAPALAALLQGAGSAAYALGPALGGAAAQALGLGTVLRALGVANLLYAALLYRALRTHPLSVQWGAESEDEDSECSGEATPLRPAHYVPME